ncbi:MAG: ATP-dependent zinc protease family protein [Nitrospirales bacterium]
MGTRRLRGSRLVWGLSLAWALAGLTPASASAGPEKLTAGWIERVHLFPGLLPIVAKLDTGAAHSSLHVPHVEEFERDGESWVRFDVVTRDGQQASFERKVRRTALIKRKRAESQERPVVTLGICLGSVYREVQVNLVDRHRFRHDMLIGRSFLKNEIVVDPSIKYTVQPDCQVPMPK